MSPDMRVSAGWLDIVLKVVLGLLALVLGSKFVSKRSVSQRNNTVTNGDIVGGDKVARKD